jgi:hypothetical protein
MQPGGARRDYEAAHRLMKRSKMKVRLLTGPRPVGDEEGTWRSPPVSAASFGTT